MEARYRLQRILESIVSKELVAPGDVVVDTGLPRYLVLAAFQCLEALGIIEPVFTKGSYKLYAARPYARKLLQALKEGAENPLLALAAASTAPIAAEGSAEAGEASVEA